MRLKHDGGDEEKGRTCVNRFVPYRSPSEGDARSLTPDAEVTVRRMLIWMFLDAVSEFSRQMPSKGGATCQVSRSAA